ncbi:MAG: DUF899 family protein [Bryobacteraceae bacterium]
MNMGRIAHLHARDTSLVLVSRAPQAQIKPFKKSMCRAAPRFSSFGGDFNFDFDATSGEDEDSSNGWPQTQPYEWWSHHDKNGPPPAASGGCCH